MVVVPLQSNDLEWRIRHPVFAASQRTLKVRHLVCRRTDKKAILDKDDCKVDLTMLVIDGQTWTRRNRIQKSIDISVACLVTVGTACSLPQQTDFGLQLFSINKCSAKRSNNFTQQDEEHSSQARHPTLRKCLSETTG